ncbi:GntR family transcriptional regulator [Brevibacterium sanguinis]|uniref:GntR family transcriptional regulator n=2 Tax=Brevibacterium TaxID=1696 RepID=A0A366IQM9_9MICO|nr:MULTISPECIES: FCD domain-containing protein [Brevibacterium]RBP68156.1 GntR family transcriptional regulator [Brevibacterium sanguinis]RBP74427.1 GntR family transcriptional regulator [Brevibacterium celere]
MTAGGNLHESVLNAVGTDIVSGALAPGTVIRTEELRSRYEVSVSVVREVVRVLESLGMVKPVRRLGLVILAMREWTILDPLVVRWRMAAHPGIQLRSLTELRVAIEPQAAHLAALHADAAAAEEIMHLAARMRSAGRSGDVEAVLDADIAYHRAVLRAGGNELFASFDSVVAEILTGRTNAGLMPRFPHPEALQWHFDVADAIGAQDPQRAHEAMTKIMVRAFDEMEDAWAGETRLRTD